MSYFNDACDVLEAAYPTCTNFSRYHAYPTAVGLERRSRGVVMVLDVEDLAALDRFKRVCYALEDSVSWSVFSLDVCSHDSVSEVLPVLAAHGEVRGASEVFWLRHGRIVAAMTQDFDASSFDELTA